MAERPWRMLRDRPEIEFLLCDLPPGVRAIHARRGEDRAILISRALSPADRLAALAHELVHDERGHAGHHPDHPHWAPCVAREENRVDNIVAGRLLPPDELAVYVDVLAEFEPVTALAVALEFDVPEHVAQRALEQLAEQRRSA